MVELIEKAITIPDERKEVMEMCLASPSTGDFKPISLSGLHSNSNSYHSNSSSMHMSSISTLRPSSEVSRIGQKHRPGRAGGGWEEDIEDNQQPVDYIETRMSEFRYLITRLYSKGGDGD